MFGNEKKDKGDEKPVPLMTRFFQGCLLLFAGVVVLWLALQLLAQFWGWLALLAGLALLAVGIVNGLRWWRDRRW